MLRIYIRELEVCQESDRNDVLTMLESTNPYFMGKPNPIDHGRNVLEVAYDNNTIGNAIASVLRMLSFYAESINDDTGEIIAINHPLSIVTEDC